MTNQSKWLTFNQRPPLIHFLINNLIKPRSSWLSFSILLLKKTLQVLSSHPMCLIYFFRMKVKLFMSKVLFQKEYIIQFIFPPLLITFRSIQNLIQKSHLLYLTIRKSQPQLILHSYLNSLPYPIMVNHPHLISQI
jgi:hypothetical protein